MTFAWIFSALTANVLIAFAVLAQESSYKLGTV